MLNGATPRGREMPKGAKQKEREMPEGARCQTAPDAEPREMPNGATAQDAERREMPKGARARRASPPPLLRAVWHFAPWRSLAFRALSAPASFSLPALFPRIP
jgi:hypothetical protein